MSNTELWREAAGNIHWFETPDTVLDSENPPFYRWFPDGVTNACYNALDLHVEQGRGDQAALIYDSPVTDTKRSYSYAELLDEVSRFAGVLAAQGVGKGDRVIVYMPMVPEALIAMLACARLGAVHSVVFGGFASNELAVRIDDASPKVIVSATCGVEPSRIVPYKPLLAKLMLDRQEKNGSWWDYPLYNYHQQYGSAFALMTLHRCLPSETPTKK